MELKTIRFVRDSSVVPTLWAALVDKRAKIYFASAKAGEEAKYLAIAIDKDDARLLKAAPDLLEALEAIAHDTADFEHGDDNLQSFVRGLNSYAERAIAKARSNG